MSRSFDDEPDALPDDMPPMEVEVTDVLDLHTFAPRDVADLVNSYIDECIDKGFPQVRIIHGKGIGTLRRIVHAALERHPGVTRHVLAGDSAGGWGATIAWLRTP